MGVGSSQEDEMKKTFLMSAASAALIAISGAAFAQSPGGAISQSGPSAPPAAAPTGSGAPQAAPSAPMNRGEEGVRGGRAEQVPGHSAQRTQERAAEGAKPQGEKSAMEPKAGDKGMKADSKNAAGPNAAGTTTGQAGAGAKLSTEQRQSVRASITKQNVKPLTNVNFSISIGTRVPRGTAFHPLPVEVVAIYPDWRGYDYILVGDQIVVVNPRTLEIVAILDA
jgi:hypothetical protein